MKQFWTSEKKPLFSELASGRAGSQWPPEPQDPLPAWFLIITTLPPIQVDVLLIFKHEQVKKYDGEVLEKWLSQLGHLDIDVDCQA